MNKGKTDGKSARLLLVDDIPANLGLLSNVLEPEGYELMAASSGKVALKLARRALPDLILLDVMMPDMNGFDTCRELKKDKSTRDIPVIFVTAKDQTEDILEGFRAGGVDYVPKPFENEELLARVRAHIENKLLTKELIQKNRELEEEIAKREQAEDAQERADERLSQISEQEAQRWGIEGFIGRSKTVGEILSEIRRLHQADTINVLITGESGTGKELIARALHFGGARSQGPFIPVNCSAIPRELAESSFFGHVRGAFTGASTSRKGHFELADGGTLFLDEIGDMPLELQATLLRVLEESCITPVGATQSKQIDVHVIAASNADLQAKIAQGKFRSDLYFRLAGFTVTVPPLRERPEDIPLLVEHFLNTFGAEMGIEHPVINAEALEALKAYQFPGNVRELKNIIEGALILSSRGRIQPRHLRFAQLALTPVLPPQESAQPARNQPSSENEAAQRRTGLDTVREFINECCEISPGFEIHKPKLLSQYQQFCHAKEYRPMSRNKFYQRVLELCPQVSATLIGEKRLAGFKGLRVKEPS